MSMHPESWRSGSWLVRQIASRIPVIPAGAFWMTLDSLKRSEEERRELKYKLRTALILTDEEKEILAKFLDYQPLGTPEDSLDEWQRKWSLIESIREKLR